MPRHPRVVPEDNKKRKFDIDLLFWLLSYIKDKKFLVGVSVLLILLSAGLGLASPHIVRVGIDDYIGKGDYNGLLTLAVIYFFIRVFYFASQFGQMYLTAYLGQKIMYRMRLDIFEHVIKLKKSYFDKNPIGKIMTRVTTDVKALNELLTSGFVNFFSQSLMLMGILVFLFLEAWKLTLILLVITMPLLIIGTILFRKKITVLYRKIRTQIAKINSFLQESISGMSIIQLFNRQEYNSNKFMKLNNEWYNYSVDSMITRATFFPFISFLSMFAQAIIVYLGGRLVFENFITFGSLFLFLRYMRMFFRPLRQISQQYNILQRAMAASEKINNILDRKKSEVYTKEGGYKGELKGEIEFKNVWFAYEEDEYVLKDVSFKINVGETIAIVGPTGSGKTTIINLIGKFYDIQRGEIFVDGINIEDWDIQYLRKQLGIVLQDVFLFSGNIFENITFYNPDFDEKEVEELAEYVNADKFINKLTNRYETKILERGKTLSFGQRQLLSFTRTLSYEPKMFILDEATSNIDSETEKYIQDATEKLTSDRTSIIIAHRLSTIENADRILVVHKGEIRERGTHKELIQKEGLYYDLYQLQSIEENQPAK
ncbi:MAG: ABC transporter ATP-binding protein [Candidatus Mcinerneyibacterium aminivorans]|uniref:ABC transporter ATP-binding protein n=1 Tax=Candidatus Mcinerneyibacterium aminivorans TaxID=2703815 RepID=A0A5D0MB16_9BACT|nr:MAG: ABC transporter ATP-binding protein [Candidatus Mcinerneyibacterium aminivorans]